MTSRLAARARACLHAGLLLVGGATLAAAQSGASHPLGLDEAIEFGLGRSYRVASQRAAIEAANEMSARAGELPDFRVGDTVRRRTGWFRDELSSTNRAHFERATRHVVTILPGGQVSLGTR